MRERREYARSNGLVLVNYKIPELKMEGKSSAYDIGGAGLRISVEKEIELGTSVEMEIYLPGDSQPILAKGEVVWAQKYCKEFFYAAVKFNIIDKKSQERIITYVRRKLSQIK